MAITLGAQPDTLTVHVSAGADFEATLVLLDDAGAEMDWPVGTNITLRFAKAAATETVWAATITGSEATFAEDKVSVDALIASKRATARLFYVNGTDDILWASGKVVVHA